MVCISNLLLSLAAGSSFSCSCDANNWPPAERNAICLPLAGYLTHTSAPDQNRWIFNKREMCTRSLAGWHRFNSIQIWPQLLLSRAQSDRIGSYRMDFAARAMVMSCAAWARPTNMQRAARTQIELAGDGNNSPVCAPIFNICKHIHTKVHECVLRSWSDPIRSLKRRNSPSQKPILAAIVD